jgi:hypothetical protein
MEGIKNMKLSTLLEGIWGAISIGFMVLFSFLLRGWYTRWGLKPEDARQALPGDEYVPQPKSEINAGIVIAAPPQKVWPWFVQLGCQRGGWYAYDLLDNGGHPSADRIVPEFQHLSVGDVIKAVPNGSFGFPVAAFEPDRFLTLGGTMDTKTGQSGYPSNPPEQFFSGDQTFYLQPLGPDTTRLIFRMRTDWTDTRLNNFIYRSFVEPISFVMGRKMLINIKKRAENNR